MYFIIYGVCGLCNDWDFDAVVRHKFRKKNFLRQNSVAELIKNLLSLWKTECLAVCAAAHYSGVQIQSIPSHHI